MFMAKGLLRNCEKDTYEDGTIPGSGYSISWNVDFESNSLEKLLAKIKDFHNIGDEAIVREDGKLLIQTYEKQLGNRWTTPTEEDFERWKQKEQDMYVVNYSYKLYQNI